MFLPCRLPVYLVPSLVPYLPRRLPPAPASGSACCSSTSPAFLRFRKALSKLHTVVRPHTRSVVQGDELLGKGSLDDCPHDDSVEALDPEHHRRGHLRFRGLHEYLISEVLQD